MDDFAQLGQGTPEQLCNLRHHLCWHSIDAILARPAPGDNRHEAVSQKKLLQGDGSWSTQKLLLGWVVDSARQTIELPPHRKLELASLFHSLQDRQRISSKEWRKVLG